MLVILLFTVLAPFLVLARKYQPRIDSSSLSETPRLSISKHTGKSNPIHTDRTRVKRFIQGGQQNNSGAIPELGLTNAGNNFVAEVGIGDPPTNCECCRFLPGVASYMHALDTLIVDTGSSTTWVGANKSYVETSTTVKTGELEVSSVATLGFLE